jgi:N6-adenosine-specific RNA methylase IME4
MIAFPDKKYKIIYADPPWFYKDPKQNRGGATRHYSTMKKADIEALPVKEIAEDDSILFLWTTMPKLLESFDLMKAWGFEYKTIAFVWYKEKTNPGFYTMSECEICLVGKKGKIPSPRGARNIRQFLSKMRSKHSEKPNEIRERIEKMFPTQKKLELFAREKKDGWDVFGNEVAESITLP